MLETKETKSILDSEKKTFRMMEVAEELAIVLDINTMAAYQRIYRAMQAKKINDTEWYKHFGEYRFTRKLTKDILNANIN